MRLIPIFQIFLLLLKYLDFKKSGLAKQIFRLHAGLDPLTQARVRQGFHLGKKAGHQFHEIQRLLDTRPNHLPRLLARFRDAISQDGQRRIDFTPLSTLRDRAKDLADIVLRLEMITSTPFTCTSSQP